MTKDDEAAGSRPKPLDELMDDAGRPAGYRKMTDEEAADFARRMIPMMASVGPPRKWSIGQKPRAAGTLFQVLVAFAYEVTELRGKIIKLVKRDGAPVGMGRDGSKVRVADLDKAAFHPALQVLLEEARDGRPDLDTVTAEKIFRIAAHNGHPLSVSNIADSIEGLRPGGRFEDLGPSKAAARLLGDSFQGAIARIRVAKGLLKEGERGQVRPEDLGGPAALFGLLALSLGYSDEQADEVISAVDPIVTPIWREERPFPAEQEPDD